MEKIYPFKITFSHQMKIYPTSSTAEITETCLQLFRRYYDGRPTRQKTINCGKVHYKKELQLNLFEAPEMMLHREDLETVIDKIRERYGFTSLLHAGSLLKDGTAIQRSHLVGGHKG